MTKLSSMLTRATAAIALAVIAGNALAQQDYPNKPIRMVLPFPPGGATNVMARLLGEKLTEAWGQTVVIDNRTGGNTIIGTDAVAKSPPDGYTILFTLNALIITPLLQSTPYDPFKDLIPVATLAKGEILLAVNPTVPANNLQELIALAKTKPGELNYWSAGSGTPPHLAAETFNTMTGVKTKNIPYKGGGPAMIDLLANRIQLQFSGPLSAIQYVQAGRLRGIAYSGEKRLAALPQVPTFAEAGLPGYDVAFWFAVLVPAGTPKPIVDKLAKEIARIAVMPDVKETMVSQGIEPFVTTPDEFAALMKADSVKFGKLIKAADIKLDQ